jgi:hypothetical protein
MAGGPTKARDNIDSCRLDTYLFLCVSFHILTFQSSGRSPCPCSNPTGSNVKRDIPDNVSHTAPISSMTCVNLFRGRINVFSCQKASADAVYNPYRTSHITEHQVTLEVPFYILFVRYDSSVGIAKSHGVDGRSSIPGRGKRFFSSPQLATHLHLVPRLRMLYLHSPMA